LRKYRTSFGGEFGEAASPTSPQAISGTSFASSMLAQAARKYRGHRVLPEGIMEELGKKGIA
jgi:hypothetical protein